MTTRMFPIPPPLPRPQESLRMRDPTRNRSFGKPLECEARGYVDDRDHEELESEPEGEVDDVENEGDRLRRSEEDVYAKGAETDETDDQPG